MKTDIQIAQEATMLPITEIAAKVDLSPDDLEMYGKYKAKLSDECMARLEKEKDGKLVLVTAINPTPAGEGKTTTSVGLGQAFGKLGKKAILALREHFLRTLFWNQRWCCRRWVCTGGSNGRSEFTFYWGFPCHYLCK